MPHALASSSWYPSEAASRGFGRGAVASGIEKSSADLVVEVDEAEVLGSVEEVIEEASLDM